MLNNSNIWLISSIKSTIFSRFKVQRFDLNFNKKLKYQWFVSLISCNSKIDEFTRHKYSHLFDVNRKNLFSRIIKSLDLTIGEKKRIIDVHVLEIDILDRVLWITIYKHSFIVKILHGMHQLLFQIRSRTNGSPKSQDLWRKNRGCNVPWY